MSPLRSMAHRPTSHRSLRPLASRLAVTSALLLGGLLIHDPVQTSIHAAEPTTPQSPAPPLTQSPARPEPLPRSLFEPPPGFVRQTNAYRSPLVREDGRTVTRPTDWPARRAEIARAWHEVLGGWPAPLPSPKLEVLRSEPRESFTQSRVRLEIAAGRFEEGWLLVPPGSGPFPAVVVPFYDPETSIGLKGRNRDFALQLARVGFVALAIGSPGGDARLPEPGPPPASVGNANPGPARPWQPLAFLAHVAANAHSALALRPDVDPRRIGIVGHSYGGKWALFAGALHEAFACVAVSDPGIVWDEARANVNYWEPWYLGREAGRNRQPGLVTRDNPRTGAYHDLVAAGRDLTELHALLAPRPFLVSGGAEDPPERWQALAHLAEIHRLLGFEGRVAMSHRPAHDPTPESNAQIVAFFLQFLAPTTAGSPRQPPSRQTPDRLRLIVETDAGGDPDDEQSLVRFLLHANEWDIEAIIANRPVARAGENLNPERTGLGIVHRLLAAYGECQALLATHDPRYPTAEALRARTVPGYNDRDDAVKRIISAVDAPDPRPVWYSDWGTDAGGATNNLRRALDQVLRERGPDGYARFKSRLRLASHDAFGPHTTQIAPPFPRFVNTFQPAVDGRRWYHRFSALTARAGGFDLHRDVLTGHGPLGALYPTNTTHWLKEGDSMTFLYLVPNGLNAPEHPGWGGWAGRYGPHPSIRGANLFWADQPDHWNGLTHRDQSLARWAEALQNDFRARLDWCVQPWARANHPPIARVAGPVETILIPGSSLTLDASASSDPDGHELRFFWFHYPEPGGTEDLALAIEGADRAIATVRLTGPARMAQAHLVLAVTDRGEPPLTRYQRVILAVRP